MKDLPVITGFQLIRLLELDGWVVHRRTRHGVALRKTQGGRTFVAHVPSRRASLPSGTLSGILSVKQTGLGREGLVQLVRKYGPR